MANPLQVEHLALTRRELLQRCGMGFGAMALGNLVVGAQQASASSTDPLLPHPPQFAAKAKRVIHLFMNGGPSHVDTFDPKPALQKYAGQMLPGGVLPTERPTGAAFPSPFKFRKYGQSGIEVSDLFRNVAGSIDDICVIRSMRADVPNHEPSLLLMNCGDARQIRPSLGSWTCYGLGKPKSKPPRVRGHVPQRVPHPGNAKLASWFSARRVRGRVYRQRSTPRSKNSSSTFATIAFRCPTNASSWICWNA